MSARLPQLRKKNKTRFKSQKTRLKRDFEFETDRNFQIQMQSVNALMCCVPKKSSHHRGLSDEASPRRVGHESLASLVTLVSLALLFG